MIKKAAVTEFLDLQKQYNYSIIDVRAPQEFKRGHIPGACNIPLFSDEGRALVGTAYKQQGKDVAMKVGLELVGPYMTELVKKIEEITSVHILRTSLRQDFGGQAGHLLVSSMSNHQGERKEKTIHDPSINSGVSTRSPHSVHGELVEPYERHPKTILLHCWRGGMRSASVAWLLSLFGYTVYLLEGGYKAYRAHVREEFEKKRNFMVLGGNTGSGKTRILSELKKLQEQVLDLENIAQHKGSVFGALGEHPQPTQEQFENNLAHTLMQLDTTLYIWVEDESVKIGSVHIPLPLWEQMRAAPFVFLNCSSEMRIQNLLEDYSTYPKEQLFSCIKRLEKHLGGLATQQACAALEAGDFEKVCTLLLKHYDKTYAHSLARRNIQSCTRLELTTNNWHEHVLLLRKIINY